MFVYNSSSLRVSFRTASVSLFRLTAVLVVTLGISISTSKSSNGQSSSLTPYPWPDANPISVSFPPDFVEIGRARSELFQHMNSQMSFPNWQIEILRAMQTWSRHANIQFAVVPDSPRAFGIPGLAQGDPRFGDIRIGAFPQNNVLGNAVPFNSGAGSWAGDIFFDTTREFYIHDSGTTELPKDKYDLYSVSLHELGNSLGLIDDETNPDSVMFFAYFGPRGDLHSTDIESLQFLYGLPANDDWEPVDGNETLQSALPISFDEDFATTLIQSRTGRIRDSGDVDVYSFRGTSLSENCWIKVRCRGRSLLCPRITAYDSAENELATISSASPLSNTIGKEITGIATDELIYVVVDWSEVPDFDFGEYQLVLDFNANGGDELEEGDDEPEEERFFEAGDDELVDELYGLGGLVDTEVNRNNTFATASTLFSPLGTPAGSRFETVSAIGSKTDLDMYRIVTSGSASGVLVIDLAPLGINPAFLDIRVFDSARRAVPVRRRFRSTGDVTADAIGIQPSSTYYVRVQNKLGNTRLGNYLLLVNASDASADMEQIQQVNLSPTNPDRFGTFTTYKTQLFRFDLSMTSSDNTNQAAQLTIYSDSGRQELVTSVRSGRIATVYAWLPAGEHYLRFSARSRDGVPIRTSTVTLKGSSISDDEGPVLLDPSGNPISGPQTPGNNPTPPPTWNFPASFVWLYDLVLPPDNPWF
jgi:Matrixin